MKPRDAAPVLGVFVIALAYLLLLRPYGFQLEDEGTLLFSFDRVMRGQQPYLDFHSGYTPGFFAFGTAVFSVFGPSATALRGVLAVVNALTAAGLAEVTRRVAGRWLAPLPPLLWLAFVPVYGGEFAAFNVPYPAWPVTGAWVVLALAMLAWMERQRVHLLVLSGVAAAFALWFRPTSGAFALAATTWVVVAVAARRSALDRAAALGAAAFMALGVWYIFEFRVVGTDAFVHLVPAGAIAVLYAGALASRFHDVTAPRVSVAMAILATAFLIPTLAWTLPLFSALGRDRFLYEVFLVGADYQSHYYKPHPPPEPYAALVVVALLASAIGGRLVARRRLPPLALLLAIGVAGVVGLMAAARAGLAPEGLVHSIVAQLENASYWLAMTASFGAVAWLGRVPAAELRGSRRARAMVVLTPLGIAMYMQMFPRSDFMHQITAAPLTIVVACGLLDRVAAWWGRGLGGSWIVRRSIQAAAIAVLLLTFGEKIRGPIEAWSNAPPPIAMPSRLAVHVEDAAGDELAAIAATSAFLREHTADGEALWSFPATSGVLFAAGSTNPTPRDYWFPGSPDHREEMRVLSLLRKNSPRFIVTLGKGWNFFAAAPVYFDALRAFVASEYRLAARYGRYDILARHDVADANASFPIVAPPAPPPGTKSAWEAVLEGNLERRRQAAWRWMAALTPEEAAHASLPERPRDQLLLLRALRDGGDMRAAAWTILGFASSEPRVRGEAVAAMLALTQALSAERARFANDFDPEIYRPFVTPWVERARALGSIEALRPFADAVSELTDEPIPRLSNIHTTR